LFASVWEASGVTTANTAIEKTQNIFKIEDCPSVVMDSLEVVLSLGIQSLWVDRYCIHLSDMEDKHDQIAQKDLIYAIAYVTTVAATNYPSYGLLGAVGSKSFSEHTSRSST
jgi:hypothetical protein